MSDTSGSSQRNRKRQSRRAGQIDGRETGLGGLEPKLPGGRQRAPTAGRRANTSEFYGSALGTQLVTPQWTKQDSLSLLLVQDAAHSATILQAMSKTSLQGSHGQGCGQHVLGTLCQGGTGMSVFHTHKRSVIVGGCSSTSFYFFK